MGNSPWRRPAGAILAALAVALAAGGGGCRRDEAISAPALLPPDLAAAAVLQSPVATATHLASIQKKFAGEHLGRQIDEAVAQIERGLGFNPFTPAGLRKAGLDPERGIAFGALFRPPITDPKTGAIRTAEPEQYVVLPVAEEKAFAETIARLARDAAQAGYAEKKTHGAGTIIVLSRQSGPNKEGREPVLAYAFRGRCALVSPGADAERLVGRMIDAAPGGGIADLPAYKDFLAQVKPADAFVYLDAESAVSMLPEAAKKRGAEKARDFVRGMGLSVGVDDRGVALAAFVGLNPDKAGLIAEVVKNPAGDIAPLLGDDALFKLVVSLDAPRFVERFVADVPNAEGHYRRDREAFVAETGIDPEKEIYPLLTGSAGAAFYPQNTTALVQALASRGIRGTPVADFFAQTYIVGVKDGKKAGEVIEKLAAALTKRGLAVSKEKRDGLEYHRAGPAPETGMALAVVGDQVRLVAGNDLPARVDRFFLGKGRKPGAGSGAPEWAALDFQVLARAGGEVDLGKVEGASGLMFRSMFNTALGVLGRLTTLTVGAELRGSGVYLASSLGLK